MSTALDAAPRITEFWMNVSIADDEVECWPWTGYKEDGYGRFFWDGRMVGAHELALTFTTGEVRAPGLDTCHRCNNPICCNPHHLRQTWSPLAPPATARRGSRLTPSASCASGMPTAPLRRHSLVTTPFRRRS